MEITSYINIDFQVISPDESIKNVQAIFNSTTFTHLPIIHNNVLVGNISEDDCKSFDNSENIEAYNYLYNAFHVKKSTSWLDVLEAFVLNETNIMPVLDEDDLYIGIYELNDILSFFNETPFLSEPGSTIVVEKNRRDYSFSEIAQIIESNNGKILGIFISDLKDNITQVTLKITSGGLNEILQTFRRYNYEVILGSEEDTYLKELKERSEYLNKYLNI
ncbi:hypothetical protein NBRC110019_00800 [Neptunitalea chrysea]|uniref:CBS domain-containing protein n=1 Tax=Neptunitalea chrysea TaxID=1647581 RepID=A0A9W6B2I8_9FLAO|nr:CBS domain-containing protein [Neptunitalea chrysea]GLB51041.1 hypothetical protein NBRC110019_00800 [Neptunitalea chrysea]